MVATLSETQTPTPGAYPGIPFLDYTRWRATNWHTLKPFGISALQGRHEMAMPPSSTDAMQLGAAFHSCVLEPESFKAQYVTMPAFDGHPNSNAYKAQKAQWLDANADKISLTQNEMRSLTGMQAAVWAHPTASALLGGRGRNELSIVWRDRESDELCKGRLDRLCRVPARLLDGVSDGDAICLVDLKKTSLFHRFDNEVARYQYHGQLAFYGDGIAALEPANIVTLIIAVQDEPPHDVAVYNADDAVEHGRKLYRRLLTSLTTHRRANTWPGICPLGTLPVVLPAYAQEKDSI